MHLCGGDGAAVALSALAGVEAGTLTGNSLGGLLNDLLALSEDHLNVAGVGHVRVDLESVSGLEEGRCRGKVDIHDREHGMCGGAAWGPG